MAKKDASFTLEIFDEDMQATLAGRMLTLPFHKGKDEEGDPVLVVEIDGAETWDDGSELALKDLQKLLERIEAECEARDIEIEFE
jgi:hypothetical protein